MLESKQSRMEQFFPIQEQITPSCSGPIGPMIEFIQILSDINILTKFGADWSLFADDTLCVNKVKYKFFFIKGR